MRRAGTVCAARGAMRDASRLLTPVAPASPPNCFALVKSAHASIAAVMAESMRASSRPVKRPATSRRKLELDLEFLMRRGTVHACNLANPTGKGGETVQFLQGVGQIFALDQVSQQSFRISEKALPSDARCRGRLCRRRRQDQWSLRWISLRARCPPISISSI